MKMPPARGRMIATVLPSPIAIWYGLATSSRSPLVKLTKNGTNGSRRSSRLIPSSKSISSAMCAFRGWSLPQRILFAEDVRVQLADVRVRARLSELDGVVDDRLDLVGHLLEL